MKDKAKANYLARYSLPSNHISENNPNQIGISSLSIGKGWFGYFLNLADGGE